ncbi:NERD domain-containing protein [Anaerobacillus sp. CMMVII]|uniref:nuclease-related domain-containing protein n=1 Tax=Anaerobacillus sp. CMMVII TaxID=2755588 RepID=UPI0021B78764|nr:nuclease-related domain-containing protein [Anaerobacillus sp. CMMVII]MCT8137283.1 NERD domain-containing protein [Anaerobacillus sp. CMMVII]
MAHLIKIEDYVSRYQYDMYRYPGQFSRLKRERWDRLKQEWEASYQNGIPSVIQEAEEQRKPLKGPLAVFRKWPKRKSGEPSVKEVKPFQFKYRTLAEVKSSFLRDLFEFQLNWASSTLREKSTIKTDYFYDEPLKWFLQSFPDNCFVLYYPIVTYPKATVQFDILIISPTDVWCIVNLDGSENTIYQTFSERYWLKVEADTEKKIINPLLSLNRMSTIVKRILTDKDLDMKVRKVVLTKKGYIDVDAQRSGILLLDQRSVYDWNEKMKNNSSPIKSVQLKFSQSLLDVCNTTSKLRDDFIVDDDDF